VKGLVDQIGSNRILFSSRTPILYTEASKDMVEQSEGERRAGDASAGHGEQRGDDAGHLHELAREAPPRVERGDAVAELGAGCIELTDERYVQLAGEAHRPLDRRAAVDPYRAVVLPPGHSERDHAAPADLGDLGGGGGVGPRVEGRRPHEAGANTNVAL
jgi:hypothetical protein